MRYGGGIYGSAHMRKTRFARWKWPFFVCRLRFLSWKSIKFCVTNLICSYERFHKYPLLREGRVTHRDFMKSSMNVFNIIVPYVSLFWNNYPLFRLPRTVSFSFLPFQEYRQEYRRFSSTDICCKLFCFPSFSEWYTWRWIPFIVWRSTDRQFFYSPIRRAWSICTPLHLQVHIQINGCARGTTVDLYFAPMSTTWMNL